MSESPRAVLFDVDDTLVDTNYLHAVTWWQAWQSFGQAGHYVPMTDIHRTIGIGSDQLPDHLLPADRDKDADPGLQASHDALCATYWSRLRPQPHAADLLRACHARGLAVVLASSAGEAEPGALRAVIVSATAAGTPVDAASAASAVPSRSKTWVTSGLTS